MRVAYLNLRMIRRNSVPHQAEWNGQLLIHVDNNIIDLA